MKKLVIILAFAGLQLASCSKNDASVSAGGGSGQGGSLARFTVAKGHLYIVDGQTLYTYSLANSQHPQLKGTVDVGMSVETIYPYMDKLFIGSQSAMYIYSIADADVPTVLGTASHVRACDPVVANDTIAYVTVRSGTPCGGNNNMLYVFDIKDITSPRQLNAIAMNSPWGLGMRGNRLYVCNGAAGLVVYDITDPVRPSVIKKLEDETFYDVIATPDGMLIGMIRGGTAIYNINTYNELSLMSKINQ